MRRGTLCRRPHTSPHLPWSSTRPRLASPSTNEIGGRVECGSPSGVVKEREGGHLANRARGIAIFAVALRLGPQGSAHGCWA